MTAAPEAPFDRRLSACGAVVLIVYTVPTSAADRGYEGWLAAEDNPFFNRIPGIVHYANWKIDGVRTGTPPEWTHFDFQGLGGRQDLERVWFSSDLDRFRKGWIAKWGYGRPDVPPVFGHAYVMTPVRTAEGSPSSPSVVSFGTGTPPSDAPTLWRVAEVVRKHFSIGPAPEGRSWVEPTSVHNPLGFDWVAVGAAPAAGATLTVDASLIAAPIDPADHCLAFLRVMEERDLERARTFVASGFRMVFPGGRRLDDLSDLLRWAGTRYRWVKKRFERIDRGPGMVFVSGTLYGEWPDGTPFEGIRFIDRFAMAPDGRIATQDVWNDLGEAILARGA
jgi:hypothetical protein